MNCATGLILGIDRDNRKVILTDDLRYPDESDGGGGQHTGWCVLTIGPDERNGIIGTGETFNSCDGTK